MLSAEEYVSQLVAWAQDKETGKRPLNEFLDTLNKLKVAIPDCNGCPNLPTQE